MNRKQLSIVERLRTEVKNLKSTIGMLEDTLKSKEIDFDDLQNDSNQISRRSEFVVSSIDEIMDIEEENKC